MTYTVPRLSMPDFARKAAEFRQALRDEPAEREPVISDAPRAGTVLQSRLRVALAGGRVTRHLVTDYDRPRDPVVFGPHQLHGCGALVASTAGACWHCGHAVS